VDVDDRVRDGDDVCVGVVDTLVVGVSV
jgi:hypothetical protein